MHNVESLETATIAPKECSIVEIPDWLRKDELVKHLSAREQHYFDACTHSVLFEYEADSLGDPVPDWDGHGPRSKQDCRTEQAYFFFLALWLHKPSPATFSQVFHAPGRSDGFSIQSTETHPVFLCHPVDVENRITALDIPQASILFAAIKRIPRASAPWTAIRATVAALQMNAPEIRHLLLWVALEALFGPQNSQESTHRLAQRIAFFLAADRIEAKGLYAEVKSAYGFRSTVAHGRWVSRARHKGELTVSGKHAKSGLIEYTSKTETLIRRSIVRLLLDSTTLNHFCGQQRDEYLEGLLFL